MTFGDIELIELKNRIEALVTAAHGAAVGALSRTYFDEALRDMMITKHKTSVLQQLAPILDETPQ